MSGSLECALDASLDSLRPVAAKQKDTHAERVSVRR
jgi:hypothetical protein